MRRQIIVVFLNCLWLAGLPAAALDRGALFKITGNAHVMYLFGEDKAVAARACCTCSASKKCRH